MKDHHKLIVGLVVILGIGALIMFWEKDEPIPEDVSLVLSWLREEKELTVPATKSALKGFTGGSCEESGARTQYRQARAKYSGLIEKLKTDLTAASLDDDRFSEYRVQMNKAGRLSFKYRENLKVGKKCLCQRCARGLSGEKTEFAPSFPDLLSSVSEQLFKLREYVDDQ